MAHENKLYERKHVFIKERSPTADTQAASTDEIKGTITVFENERGKFFSFIPFGLENVTTDDWAVVNGNNSIVSFKNRSDDKESVAVTPNPLLRFRYCFNLNHIRSIRRHHMLDGIGTLIFVLTDGTTLPRFHFNIGGSRELLELCVQCLSMKKSVSDNQTYIVKDDGPTEAKSETVSVFDQMNLFDDSNNMMKRMKRSDPRRKAIEKFSKVTNFLKDAFLGQYDDIAINDAGDGTLGADVSALMESFSKDFRESNKDGFEFIFEVDFKNLPEVVRSQPLTSKEWQNYFDKDGRINDVKNLKERIFRGGLECNMLRRDVWKYLLNYFPWSSTSEERMELSKQKKAEYFTMKIQWKTMTEQQKQKNAAFRERESLIDKDVIRTDRTHEYFHAENSIHLEILHDVLMTYSMYNFDLGYVQGMNDLLSPILIVMEDEVDAFWCFAGLMERMEQNFHMDQSHIRKQLTDLHILLQFIDAELANYLVENNSSNMYFFFRWMLICFKREFSFDDVMYLWEVLWTDHLCENFELLVCLAILISQKKVIMESKFGCNEILKHINDLSLKVPLQPLLKHAEGLYILLKQHDQTMPGLPQAISEIVFSKKTKVSHHERDVDLLSAASSVRSSREPSPNPNVERKPRTRQLTESHSINEHDSAVIGHTNNA